MLAVVLLFPGAPEAAAAATAQPALASGLAQGPAPLPANTVVELEMVDALSSATAKAGDLFAMRVAVEVKLQGVVLIPSGSPATGQVVHAQKSRGGGKAGELILAARYVDTPTGRIKLRSGFGAAAANRTGAALGASFAIGPFAMLIKGKEMLVPAGAALSARCADIAPVTNSP